MSEIGILASLQRRYTEIQAELERAQREPTPAARDRLRGEIVGLYRDTDALLERLAEFKEEIRPLVERYKAVFRTPPESAPAPATRVDHLGASTYLERGWSAIAGGNYEQALRELGRALELAPGTTRAEALLGWAQMRLGRMVEARATLEAILAREPGHPLARTNLGYVCLQEGRYAEAIEHLSAATRGTDRTASLYAHLYLGMVYTQREMYRDARAFLQQALELGPNLIEAFWELGCTYYREGNRELALAAWQKGAETNRFNPWGERCQEAVTLLQAGNPVFLD